MAAEVIALLHSLLTAPESNTAQIWTSTAEKVADEHVLLCFTLVELLYTCLILYNQYNTFMNKLNESI